MYLFDPLRIQGEARPGALVRRLRGCGHRGGGVPAWAAQHGDLRLQDAAEVRLLREAILVGIEEPEAKASLRLRQKASPLKRAFAASVPPRLSCVTKVRNSSPEVAGLKP